MCNPPFFASLAEAGANPGTACGGTAAEMVCPGGELAFVRRMVQDSQALGKRVHWYTTMVRRWLLGVHPAAAAARDSRA
jgi:23S rRNA (adenine1618-N6)-methyltransferase